MAMATCYSTFLTKAYKITNISPNVGKGNHSHPYVTTSHVHNKRKNTLVLLQIPPSLARG